ncbi:unnamed protein product [marine sediment metagenome]|uniref:Uncharacterized protein n=1 Tax=marine sediment metagenome TaxID=412755 RepID=X0UMN5_9ZZZZ
MKNGTIFLILIILVGVAFFFFNGDISNGIQETSGEIQRVLPLESDGTFLVEYKVTREGDWVAILEDTVSSNCKFQSGENEIKTVLFSGTSLPSIEVTGNDCVFDGDYNFITSEGVETIKKFEIQTVI